MPKAIKHQNGAGGRGKKTIKPQKAQPSREVYAA